MGNNFHCFSILALAVWTKNQAQEEGGEAGGHVRRAYPVKQARNTAGLKSEGRGGHGENEVDQDTVWAKTTGFPDEKI